MSGQATYLNRHTGETYRLGFELRGDETALGRAWDLVKLAAEMNGWRWQDVIVKVAK